MNSGSPKVVGNSDCIAWQLRRSWVEIDLKAIVAQARKIKAHTQRELIAVVKADAYGHGAVPVAKALENDAAMFGVANLLEALKLKEAGIEKPILILGSALPEEAAVAIQEGFELTLALSQQLDLYDRLAGEMGVQAKIHIALDTGMGRIGIMDIAVDKTLGERLSQYRHLHWRSVATHLPCSDEDELYTVEQMERFHACVQKLIDCGLEFDFIHVCNSAGSLGYIQHSPSSTLIRVGLWLYGVNPLRGTGVIGEAIASQMALTWKTRITAVREVPKGRSISYGRTYVTPESKVIATVACGYADGYPRQINGKGFYLLVKGKRCPILGRITMDQMMVDVTEIADSVELGDEVVVLGQQGDEVILPEDLANLSGTISWDIFTGIGPRSTRFYLANEAFSGVVTPANL